LSEYVFIYLVDITLVVIQVQRLRPATNRCGLQKTGAHRILKKVPAAWRGYAFWLENLSADLNNIHSKSKYYLFAFGNFRKIYWFELLDIAKAFDSQTSDSLIFGFTTSQGDESFVPIFNDQVVLSMGIID